MKSGKTGENNTENMYREKTQKMITIKENIQYMAHTAATAYTTDSYACQPKYYFVCSRERNTGQSFLFSSQCLLIPTV